MKRSARRLKIIAAMIVREVITTVNFVEQEVIHLLEPRPLLDLPTISLITAPVSSSEHRQIQRAILVLSVFAAQLSNTPKSSSTLDNFALEASYQVPPTSKTRHIAKIANPKLNTKCRHA